MRNSLLIAVISAPVFLVTGFWNPPTGSTRFDSARWIDSGLELERLGDYPQAESDLLEAARVDRLFQPGWALAGFYFRRGNQSAFWHWTRLALLVGSRDLGALFDMCWKMPGGAGKLSAGVMPDSTNSWKEYLNFLMTTDRWPAAALAAQRIAARAVSGGQGILVNYCVLGLEHDRAGAGIVWNTLRRRGLVPFAFGPILTNGDFRSAPSGIGFDWRLPNPALNDSVQPGQVSFTLNGFQNERELLLEQPLSLDPSRAYRLTFEFKTNGLDEHSGVRWVAGSDRSEQLSSPEWSRSEFDFSGSAPSLVLVYQRSTGSRTAVGTVFMRAVSAVAR